MSATVTYKGVEIATVENETKTLNTAGTYCEADIEVTDVSSGGGVGELVYEGSMAVTADTNLWQYVNVGLESDDCVYVVVLQDVYIENHYMDRIDVWTLFLNTNAYERPQPTNMGDSNDDYVYDVGIVIDPFSSETCIDSGASGSGASAFRANIVKIVKFIL